MLQASGHLSFKQEPLLAPEVVRTFWLDLLNRNLSSEFFILGEQHPPETSLPPAEFYQELAKRGCETTLSEETTLA